MPTNGIGSRYPTRMAPRKPLPPVHLRPFFDAPSGEPVWLLLTEQLRTADRTTVRREVAEYARRQHDTLAVLIVPPGHGAEMTSVLVGHCNRTLCDLCESGKDCVAWQRVGTFHAGYRPRRPSERVMRGESPKQAYRDIPRGDFGRMFEEWTRQMFGTARGSEPAESRVRRAAGVLGVSYPCTRDAVITAFRARASAVHPDHGGTDAQMREAIEARDVLLRGL